MCTKNTKFMNLKNRGNVCYTSVTQNNSLWSPPIAQSGRVLCQERPDPTVTDPVRMGCKICEELKKHNKFPNFTKSTFKKMHWLFLLIAEINFKQCSLRCDFHIIYLQLVGMTDTVPLWITGTANMYQSTKQAKSNERECKSNRISMLLTLILAREFLFPLVIWT